MTDMDEMEEQEPMPQEPTNNLFLVVGSFGLLAFLVGAGFIVAASLGFLK
jgi:hypothetical protein